MQGGRVVREWNYNTGAKRTWMKTLDRQGNIRIVRPENGPQKTHYMFDQFGNYLKKF